MQSTQYNTAEPPTEYPATKIFSIILGSNLLFMKSKTDNVMLEPLNHNFLFYRTTGSFLYPSINLLLKLKKIKIF